MDWILPCGGGWRGLFKAWTIKNYWCWFNRGPKGEVFLIHTYFVQFSTHVLVKILKVLCIFVGDMVATRFSHNVFGRGAAKAIITQVLPYL